MTAPDNGHALHRVVIVGGGIGGLVTAPGEILPATTIHYDTLILALGSQVNDFGTPGVLEHCHFIDDIGQATTFNDLLRSRVVLAANAGADLPVVIVGGGATGVELTAELAQRMEIVSS